MLWSVCVELTGTNSGPCITPFLRLDICKDERFLLSVLLVRRQNDGWRERDEKEHEKEE